LNIEKNCVGDGQSFPLRFFQNVSMLLDSSFKKISDIVNPPKIDENISIIKKAIELFYQINQMEDFDHVEQF